MCTSIFLNMKNDILLPVKLVLTNITSSQNIKPMTTSNLTEHSELLQDYDLI